MGYEHIPVDTKKYTCKDLMGKFNIGRTAAKATKRRGYITKMTKNIKVMAGVRSGFNTDLAYNVARSAFRRRIDPTLELGVRFRDDCVQEAVLGMIEQSGCAKKGKSLVPFYFVIAVNYMNAFLKREKIKGTWQYRTKNFADMSRREACEYADC